jgi:hypothetical protein
MAPGQWRETMRMRLAGLLSVGAAALAGMLAAGTARAEVVYPGCMTQADGRVSCSFTSLEQCQASGAGKGAVCSANAQYQGRRTR